MCKTISNVGLREREISSTMGRKGVSQFVQSSKVLPVGRDTGKSQIRDVDKKSGSDQRCLWSVV